MLTRPLHPMQEFDAGIDASMNRAAQRAREVAARTGTAVVYEIDGKLVREYPTLDEFRSNDAADQLRDGGFLVDIRK